MFPLVLLAGAGIGFWLFMQKPKALSGDEQSRASHARQQEILLDSYPLAAEIIHNWTWHEDWMLELRDMQNDARILHNQRLDE